MRPFQENKPPKYKRFSDEKASGLEGFKFWNYLRAAFWGGKTSVEGQNYIFEAGLCL